MAGFLYHSFFIFSANFSKIFQKCLYASKLWISLILWNLSVVTLKFVFWNMSFIFNMTLPIAEVTNHVGLKRLAKDNSQWKISFLIMRRAWHNCDKKVVEKIAVRRTFNEVQFEIYFHAILFNLIISFNKYWNCKR